MGNTTINAGFVGKIIGNYSIIAGENHEIHGCLMFTWENDRKIRNNPLYMEVYG